MSIVWSALSGGMYIGIEAWVKSGPDASGRVVVRADYFIEAEAGYAHAWTYPWHWSGTGGSGSANVTYNSTYSHTPRVQLPGWDVAVQAEYGRATWATFNASLGPIFNGGNPSVSVSVQVPARPYLPPAAPTQVEASRVSDTQVNLTWQTASTATAPVLAQGVERKSAANPQWVRVATLHTPSGGAPALAWTDNTVSGNDEYTYRVWGDSGVQGKKTESNPVATTPTPPANVQAVKQADMSITVTWASTAPFTGAGWSVYDNGQQVADVPAAQTTLTHTGASVDGAHTYTVRMLSSNGLESALSAPSNTVVVLAPPNPPQPTAPLGFAQAGRVTFAWVHNPVDSTAQTKANVRWKPAGSTSSWSHSRANAASTLAATIQAGSYEWQVRTKGLHGTYSPWSSTQVFDVVDAPGVSILNPEDQDTYPYAILSAAWSYYQAQGAAQAGATVTVTENPGQDSEKAIVKQNIQGDVTEWTMPGRLKNGTTYTVEVQALSGHGIVSNTAESTFTVDFPQPPAPEVTVTWDEQTGSATVSITNHGPQEAGQPETAYNTLERSIDGGETWETIADHLPLSPTLTDPECLSRGTTLYRVTANSDLPSAAQTITSVEADSQAIWVNGGRGMAVALPLAWDPQHSVSVGLLNRQVHYFAGRRHGVELSGVHRKRVFNLDATLLDSRFDLVERLEELSYLPGPFMYRDPLGRRVYASLSGVQVKRAVGGTWSLSATLEEVDK